MLDIENSIALPDVELLETVTTTNRSVGRRRL